ncbi:MAG: AAA family ATPase [Kofleriaceae bacterium]|nr:AAA family ATPase [Kofleriaceae bacterium]MBP6839472.1 AAA family ATPase [Kofleriaceae bacterium]
MLRSLRLIDWKSFGSAEVELGPLTLLVGPNGSGKSNALDALRFLQGAALDFPLGDALRGRWEGGRELWPAIRGAAAEAATVGKAAFTLETTWDRDVAGVQQRCSHTLEVDTQGDVSVRSESLKGGQVEFFSATNPSGGSISARFKARGSGQRPVEQYSVARSLLGQLEPIDRMHEHVVPVARDLRRKLREATFLDIRPALMRDYRPVNGGHLGTSGENVSPVLMAMDTTTRERITDWLTELCGPEFAKIELEETKLREVMFYLVETAGRRTSARSASDGTLRFLGEVVALLTAKPFTTVVLEEPDVGLHPSRIQLLANLLEHVTSHRQIQVIATTHSATLLAHLSKRALADVVAFGRGEPGGLTVCSRVGRLPHFESLANSDHLESLISTGWLERAL